MAHTPAVAQENWRLYQSIEYWVDTASPTVRGQAAARLISTGAGAFIVRAVTETFQTGFVRTVANNIAVGPGDFAAVESQFLGIGETLFARFLWIDFPVGESTSIPAALRAGNAT